MYHHQNNKDIFILTKSSLFGSDGTAISTVKQKPVFLQLVFKIKYIQRRNKIREVIKSYQ